MTRPRHTKKDGNHAEIVQELREAGYIVIDVADLPGDPEHNPLDVFVADKDAAPVIVAYNVESIMEAVRFYGGWVQTEIKPHWRSGFTPNEQAYLDARGVTTSPAPLRRRATIADRATALEFALECVEETIYIYEAEAWTPESIARRDEAYRHLAVLVEMLAELKGEP